MNHHVLALVGTTLGELPRRRTDGSYVVSEETHLKKHRMVEGEVKRLKREKGIEQQYRYNCSDCGLFLCYRPVHWGNFSKYSTTWAYIFIVISSFFRYLYILENALTSETVELEKKYEVLLQGALQHRLTFPVSFRKKLLSPPASLDLSLGGEIRQMMQRYPLRDVQHLSLVL